MVNGPQAWIYTGTSDYVGVDLTSVSELKSKLESCCDNIKVLLVEAEALQQLIDSYSKSSCIAAEKITIVFPGGEPTKWDNQLGPTVEKIRKFVEAGSRALMVCAGAYFSAESSCFKVSDSISIEKKRSLRFFPGSAIGPISDNALAIQVKNQRTHSLVNLYCNGGGYFVPNKDAEEGKDYHVIARYADESQRIAMCFTDIKKGRVVMSFPHFEFDGLQIAGVVSNEAFNMSSISSEIDKTRLEKTLLVQSIFDDLFQINFKNGDFDFEKADF